MPFWRPPAPHQNIDSAFQDCMYVLAKCLTYEIQSIKLTSTDFWSPYLVQMGAEIRQSVADVDTDSLLSQNWPPSPSIRWRSCSETESATTDRNGRKKNGKKRTERYGIPNFRTFRKSLATSTPHICHPGLVGLGSSSTVLSTAGAMAHCSLHHRSPIRTCRS